MNKNTLRETHLIGLHRCFLLVACLLSLGISNESLATSVPAQNSCLHQAVIHNDANAVQSLLQEGAKVDATDKRDRTALVLAAARGHTTIMELLLKAGAHTHGRKQHIPLHEAALYGQVESMRKLIHYGASVNKFDHVGFTPLDSAIMGGQLEAIQFLLSHKAKQKRNKQDKGFPLHIAAKGGFEFTRRFFRHVLECEQTSNYDKVMRFDDATLRASEKEVLSIIECLLEHGGQVHKKDSQRETPLYHAVRKQYSEVTKLLIEHGAEVDIINKIGLCPLHYAAENEGTAIAQALIEQGASVNCESIRGDTPLQIAVINKRPMMASFLWDRGANILRGNPSPVTLLLNSEYETAMQPFILHILETDKNINGRKGDSFDWVLRAIMATRNLSIIRIALQQKILDANYRIRNANMTVLGLATMWGHIDTVKLLIEHGAEVNMPVHTRKKTKGKTPLHYAARRGSVEIAKLLIEYGADINAKSSRGNTPLKYALKHQHKDMIQWLEKHRAVTE